jgi:hypothetical protein
MNCHACGFPVEADAKFCPQCFARIEPPGLLRRMLALFQKTAKPVPRIVKTEKSVTIRTMDEDGKCHEYHSMNEVPLETRSQIEELASEEVKDEAGFLSAESLTQAKIPPGVIRRKSSVLYKIKDASGQERIYHSLDEVPWEMRSQIKALETEATKEASLLSADALEEARGASSLIRQKSISVYKIKDAAGQERTYHSLDELPPEIREALKRLKN